LFKDFDLDGFKSLSFSHGLDSITNLPDGSILPK
jgi:hypothetical protein